MEFRRYIVNRVFIALVTAAQIFTAGFGVVALMSAGTAEAAPGIPYRINFQGRLTDNNGSILPDGDYNIKLRIFDAASGGTNLWEASRVYGAADRRVTVTNGIFSIQLGDTAEGDPALGPSIFNSVNLRYLEIELPSTATKTCATNGCAAFTEGPFTPRHIIGASPYSFVADTLDGLDSTDFAQLTAANSFTGANLFAPTTASTVALTVKASTAGGANGLEVFDSAGTRQAYFDASGNLNVARTIQATANNTIDLGTSGNAFRTGYFGTSLQSPSFTGSGAVTLSSGGSGALTLDSASNVLQIAANDTTLRRTAAGTYTVDLSDTAATTLAVTNSNATGGAVANLTVDGGISIGSGQTYKINGVQISTGALSDSATITMQGNTFNGSSQLVQTTGAGALPALSGVNLTNLDASDLATGSGAVTIQSGGSAALTLTSASGTVSLGSNTIQRNNSTLTIDVNNATASTLSILNSTASQVANLNIDGGITIGSGQAITVGSTAGSTVTACGANQYVASFATAGGVVTGGTCTALPAGSGANTALSNLASVAINQGLVANANNTLDLGTSGTAWRAGYFGTSIQAPSYTGAGAVTLSSGGGAALTVQPSAGGSLIGSVTKSAATGDEVAFDLSTTINKSTSGNYTAFKLNVNETSTPGSNNLLMDLQLNGNSWFSVNDGGNVTNAGNTFVQGGTSTLGGASVAGALVLHDGSGQTITVSSGNVAANRALTIPAATGSDTFCLQTLGNCAGGGGGSDLQAAYNASTSPATITTTAAKGLVVAAGAVPTADMMTITNAGQPVTTAGVNGLNVNFVGGAAAVESSGVRIDFAPGSTSGGTWSGLRIVANATGPAAGITGYGIKLEGPTTPGAGTEKGLYIGTGWDIGMDVQSGGIQLAAQSDPSAPAAGNLRIYAKDIAGRIMPKWVGPAGVDTPMQAGLGFNRVSMMMPAGGATLTSFVAGFGTTFTNTGTANNPTPTSTSLLTSVRRATFSSGATAGTVASHRQSVLQVWRGNAAGLGGFFYTIRFGTSTLVAGNRAFVGMSDSTAAPTNVDPTTSTTPGRIGMAINANTGNWKVVNNVSGTAPTSTDLGANFPVNNSTLYELVIYSPPNGSAINYRVTNMSTGNQTSGSWSANIPATTTFLAPQFWITNNTTASAAILDFSGWYLESDN